jgi:hypothetical protein
MRLPSPFCEEIVRAHELLLRQRELRSRNRCGRCSSEKGGGRAREAWSRESLESLSD